MHSWRTGLALFLAALLAVLFLACGGKQGRSQAQTSERRMRTSARPDTIIARPRGTNYYPSRRRLSAAPEESTRDTTERSSQNE